VRRPLSPDAVVAAILTQLDDQRWRLVRSGDGVQVFGNKRLPVPVPAWRTVSEHAADLDSLAGLLDDRLLETLAATHPGYRFGEAAAGGSSVLRFGFAMPAGLQPREIAFQKHGVRISPNVHVVALCPVADEALPAVRDGFVQARAYPSGIRIKRLSGGRTRVEHLAVEDQAGRVPHWAQRVLLGGWLAGTQHTWWKAFAELAAEAEG
jgi:hypothetical protein